MATVRELLTIKGHEIWSIAPQATAYEALQLMSEKDVGALLVVEKGKLVGIFSERDYARKVVLEGRSSRDTNVDQLMSHEVLYVEPQNSTEDCMALMTAKRVRHLPVMENNQLIGIVTIGDVVKQAIADRQFAIHQLEKYITGEYLA